MAASAHAYVRGSTLHSGNLGEIRIASSENAPERIAYCLTRMLPIPR
jgi:hypothetical protein